MMEVLNTVGISKNCEATSEDYITQYFPNLALLSCVDFNSGWGMLELKSTWLNIAKFEKLEESII